MEEVSDARVKRPVTFPVIPDVMEASGCNAAELVHNGFRRLCRSWHIVLLRCQGLCGVYTVLMQDKLPK